MFQAMQSRRSIMTIFRAVASLCMMVGLASCSHFPGRATSPKHVNQYPNEAMDHIVQNMVYTLAQVESLHPMKTTLQITMTPPSRKYQHMSKRLWEAGYALQKGAPNLATLPLVIDYSEENMISGAPFIYSVTAGNVKLSRRYKINNAQAAPITVAPLRKISERLTLPARVISDSKISDGLAVPLSAMTIQGAQPTPILSNDDIFNTPLLAHITNIVFEQPSTAFAQTERGQQSPADANRAKENVYDILQSNFESTFSKYEDIDTATIFFGNDSLKLGQWSKQLIQTLALSIDPSSDIVSLIGCSHGNTSFANGNEALALGRVGRVREEFLYAGIAQDQILDEGCWAPQPYEVMPSRAVVVTIKRVKG